ncbi:MAG: hypothetical protein IJL53_09265 [Firmicutes bacterium]|nr:hypothetical protein [Bacillota bacterium]
MFITFLKKLGKILGRGLLVLAVLFILYTLIRYPLRSTVPRLIHMDPAKCELKLWRWGKEAVIKDEEARQKLLHSLEGKIERKLVGDWIMHTSGPDWALILSDGQKQVGLGLRPSAYYSIYFGHYEYTANNMVSYTELKRMFEKALNGYGSRR